MGAGVQGVHHIGVSVPDLARARESYIDLRGAVGGTPEIRPSLSKVRGLRALIFDLDQAADRDL